ncbi:hypothetical protein Tco_0762826 [Tanacetum coccineum]
MRKPSGSSEEQSAEKEKELSEEELQKLLVIIPVEEVYVEALQVKYPIIDWKVYSEDTRRYWRIIRVGNHTEAYQIFADMLKRFYRDDLVKLLDLVKERFSTTNPTDDKEKELGHEIFMLVEKDYPLTKGLLTLMLINKLQVDQHSEMANELLNKIFILVNRPRQGGLLGIKAFQVCTAGYKSFYCWLKKLLLLKIRENWNYNMYNMGKTIGEQHALLIEYEKCLPKKAATPQVLLIQGGRIKNSNKKFQNAKGKGKRKGKDKDKLVYTPKPKHPKPLAKEHPEKDGACHHCKKVGSFKKKKRRRKCHVYLLSLMEENDATCTASSSGIFTMKLLFFPPNKS